MRSVNVQVWLSATQVASIARHMELSGDNSRRLSEVARIAVEIVAGLLQKKGIVFESEAQALRYLEERGFQVNVSERANKKIVQALQEEALADVPARSIDERREELDRLISEQQAAEGALASECEGTQS